MSNYNIDSEIVFDYLKGFFLSRHPEFTYLTGDHSFYYSDDRDTIIVYVHNRQITVILDGKKDEVQSVIFSTPIYQIDFSDSDEEREYLLNATYLQPILGLL